MYENAATLKFQSGKFLQALSILQDIVLPSVLEQLGLIHIALIPDPEHDKVSVVSLWNKQDDALALEQNADFLRAIGKLDPLLTLQPDPETESLRQISKLVIQTPLN